MFYINVTEDIETFMTPNMHYYYSSTYISKKIPKIERVCLRIFEVLFYHEYSKPQ